MRETQKTRIINLLKDRGDSGVYVYELITPKNDGGLGVAQYNARIYELRREGYKIENVETGKFVLTEIPLSERPYKMVVGEDNIARRVCL